MPFSEQLSDGELVQGWSGDVDARTAYLPYESAVAAFDDHPVDRVTIDLGGLTFADSTALGSMVRISELAAEHGADLTVRNVPPLVRSLLSMTGLDHSLTIADR